MKTLLALLFSLLTLASARAQDFIENLDRSLRGSFFGGNVTFHLSGLLDVEGYYTEQPTVGLLTNNSSFLFNPRLTFYIDAQITPAVYFSAIARFDRGFDPADKNLEARLDQYVVSIKPWSQAPVLLKLGKFPSAVGTYPERYESWTNPFITAPLPYENLTAEYDFSSPYSPQQFNFWRYQTNDVYERVPIIWGPDYANGAAILASFGPWTLDAEVKNAALSSRPSSWDIDRHTLDHPTWSGHLQFQPSATWRFGLAGSIGPYFRPGTGVITPPFPGFAREPAFPRGRTIDDYQQTTIAEDVTYEWRHWQLWAEFFESRFETPRVGNADTFAWYLEAKYKVSPQFFVAARWNQQLFSRVPIGDGRTDQWGNDVWRIDLAATWRWTPSLQTKIQYSFTDQNLPQRMQEHLVAGQFTVRF